MHITLTGNLGSGKSTVSKILVNEYGYEYYSTGVMIRKLAAEHGLSVLEMNQLMQTDPKYDHAIDDTTTRLSIEEKGKKIIFDSRLAWHFAEESFKVFLSVNIDEAARRVYSDSARGDVEAYKSQAECKEKLLARAETENVRYKDIYNLDYFNMQNYNLMLDSTCCEPELLARVMEAEHDRYVAALNEGSAPAAVRVLMSPERLGAGDSAANTDVCKPYCKETTAVIRKEGDDYVVVSGMEEVTAACNEGYPLVAVVLAE